MRWRCPAERHLARVIGAARFLLGRRLDAVRGPLQGDWAVRGDGRSRRSDDHRSRTAQLRRQERRLPHRRRRSSASPLGLARCVGRNGAGEGGWTRRSALRGPATQEGVFSAAPAHRAHVALAAAIYALLILARAPAVRASVDAPAGTHRAPDQREPLDPVRVAHALPCRTPRSDVARRGNSSGAAACIAILRRPHW